MSRERELLREIIECFRGVWSHSPEGRTYLLKCDSILAQPEAEPAPAAGETPLIDTCDHGHKFAKLSDHPLRDSVGRCPHCLAAGFDELRSENERLRKLIEESSTTLAHGKIYVCIPKGENK